jgi:hypothetical protein
MNAFKYRIESHKTHQYKAPATISYHAEAVDLGTGIRTLLGSSGSRQEAKRLCDAHKARRRLTELNAAVAEARQWHADGKTTVDEHSAYIRTLVRRLDAARTKIEALS